MDVDWRDVATLILVFLLAWIVGFWVHLLSGNAQMTGLTGALVGMATFVNRESLLDGARWIPIHLNTLWRGKYPTLSSTIYLVSGTVIIPVFFLIVLVPLSGLLVHFYGIRLSSARVGEAINLPLLTYTFVAIIGTWSAASREQSDNLSSLGKRSKKLILAKLFVLIYAIGWIAIALALAWLWFIE